MPQSPQPPALVLPTGVRLLHVGPHKTGTATLQGAFHAGRPQLRAQGVRYAGRTRQAIEAAHAVTAAAWQGAAGRAPGLARWRALVDEVERAREGRVVISSESFANADDDQVRRIAADLDPARLHLVITVRPLARVIPSRWQQSVQDGITSPFETWLSGILEAPQTSESGFWRCQRHDQLAARWAAAIGTERVTVVVVDDADHRYVLDVFEGLLGLRPGTLAPNDDATNRSLTLPEVEAVRAFNTAFVGAGLGSALASPLHGRVMRRGAAAFMKSRPPAAGEPRVELPGWAVEPISVISDRIATGLERAGVRVIGDLGRLRERPRSANGSTQAPAKGLPAGADGGPPVCIPPEVAASMALGVVMVTGNARGTPGSGWPALATVARVTAERAAGPFTTYQLAGTVGGRAWNQVLRWLDTARGKRSRRVAALERALVAPRRWAAQPAGPERAAVVAATSAAASGMPPRCVPAEETAGAALDLLVATGYLQRSTPSPDGAARLRAASRRWAEPPELALVSNLRLLRVIARRALGRPGR